MTIRSLGLYKWLQLQLFDKNIFGAFSVEQIFSWEMFLASE
jgi:hypothetical protein